MWVALAFEVAEHADWRERCTQSDASVMQTRTVMPDPGLRQRSQLFA